MKIECANCKVDMGEIRDARLRKGIVHLCGSCFTTLGKKAMAADLQFKQSQKNPAGTFDDLFGGMFRR